MSKVAGYIAAGFIVENPENPDEVIYAPPIRIAKADVEQGCFELAASTDGWTEGSGVPAPQFCTTGIKNYANQKMAAGVQAMLQQQAQAQYQAWLASRS